MNCDDAKKLFDALDGLTTEQNRELEAHCLICRACACELALLKAVNALREPLPSERLNRAVMEKLKEDFAPALKVSDCVCALAILIAPVLAALSCQIVSEHNIMSTVSSSFESYRQLLPGFVLDAAEFARRNMLPAQSPLAGISGVAEFFALALGLLIVLASGILPAHKLDERRHL